MSVSTKSLQFDMQESWFDQGDGLAPNLTVLYGGESGVSHVTSLSSGGALTGTTVTHGTVLSPTGVATTSPFVINITWDSSVASAPTGFQTAIINAAQYLESQFTNAVTVNINVGYGEVNGSTMGSGALGQSMSYLTSVSYSSLVSALQATKTDTTDASVIASLPATAPVSGYIWVSTAEAKALGLTSATGTSTDGFVGFSSTYGFTYNDTNGVAAGTYDLNGTALHELTEVMGRMMFTGGSIGSYSPSYTLLDLLHYSSAGVRDFSASTPGYFSADGGTTNSGGFNTVSGGDAGDWGSTMGNDALNAFSYSGVVNGFSASDLKVMDAIGWAYAGGTPLAKPPAPTGISVVASTSALSSIQGTSGLNGGRAIATVSQVGGQSGDSFTYTLGGTGAGAFKLTSSGNVGSLTTNTSGVTGGVNGAVYALTITANDTTGGVSSSASPLDVIVAGSSADTVPLATLVGAGSVATPTFIYGLAGADTLNGSGMTGKLWFEGGAGADTMTGGSGANAYLYGATSESTVAAADTVTNFKVATDTIDLTAVTSHALSYLGAFTGSTLSGYSIGYQTVGGNTQVYVNAGSTSASLSSSSLMEIKMAGAIALIGSDFLHH